MEAFPGSDGGDIFRVGGDQLLGERRVAHVEQFAGLIEFPAGFADIPVARELMEYPRARLAFFTAHLGGKTTAVDHRVRRKLGAGQRGKRREEIARVHEVGGDPAGWVNARPADDHRHTSAAIEHRTLGPGESAAADGGAVGPTAGGAVVTEENHEGLFAKLQPIQFRHQLTDQLIHIDHIVRVVVFAVRCAVGRRQNLTVRV